MGLRDDLSNAFGVFSDSVGVAAKAAGQWANDNIVTPYRTAQVDDELAKAAAEAKRQGKTGSHDPVRDPKANLFDPFDVVAAMNFRERPSRVSYETMRASATTIPVLADVINVRAHQVTMFTVLPEDRYSPGFRIRHKDWRNRVPTKKEKSRAADLEHVLLNTGYVDQNYPENSVPFTEFTKMSIFDTLAFDQLNWETVPDRRGKPSYMQLVDPATIRLLDPKYRKDPDSPYAVQILSGSVVADFTPRELCFCVRNPRSAIRSYGYGVSEVETLVREITGFLWSIDYNRRFFVNGSATKGSMNFKGMIPEQQMQAFRRQWYAMVSGVTNAWKTPITNAEGLEWINLQMSNRDMEYSAWMDFLIKVVCARFLIAPEEVQFSYGNIGQAQAMGNVPVEEKLKASRDLGLHPLVRWYFNQINRNFISRIDPMYEAIPVGLDSRGPGAEAELLKQQTEVFLTVDEARQRVELEPLGEEQGGNVILNPTWLQHQQNLQMADQEAEAAEMAAMEGEEEDEFVEPEPDPMQDAFDEDVYGPDGIGYGLVPIEDGEEPMPEEM